VELLETAKYFSDFSILRKNIIFAGAVGNQERTIKTGSDESSR